MISIDSIESNTKKRGVKGRLVRSLDFDEKKSSTTTSTSTSVSRSRRKSKTVSASIWRDPLKNVIQPAGFTTHKMSSVTNNFMSSDISSSMAASESEIDEMVEDLVDPGSGTLVFPQHDEVFRTSPLSNSSFIAQELDPENEDENDIIDGINNSYDDSENFHFDYQSDNSNSIGMAWNPKQNRWVPLIYRYVFPSSIFTVPSAANSTVKNVKSTNWSIKNGNLHIEACPSSTTTPSESRISRASFTFPPPQKSIMMGDSDARDVCEKLLELMDDENLMFPVLKLSASVSSPIRSNQSNQSHHQQQQQQKQQQQTPLPGKSLLSEWSSLPSSPPPPIFHDVCNRPIPELRLSPPMTGKSLGKRLFAAATATASNATNNSPCESPLTKRLRFSSSSSSIV